MRAACAAMESHVEMKYMFQGEGRDEILGFAAWYIYIYIIYIYRELRGNEMRKLKGVGRSSLFFSNVALTSSLSFLSLSLFLFHRDGPRVV